jgi:hypothetical protein
METTMDLFDCWWNYHQQQQIGELRSRIESMNLQQDLAGFNARSMKALAEENQQLKTRLGLLVRLLISKGAFTAKEYADLIAEAQPRASEEQRIAAATPSKPRRPGNKQL